MIFEASTLTTRDDDICGLLLCDDVLERIMYYLDAKHLARCMAVSQQWRLCGNLDSLWAKHLYIEFGLSQHHPLDHARQLFASCMVGGEVVPSLLTSRK